MLTTLLFPNKVPNVPILINKQLNGDYTVSRSTGQVLSAIITRKRIVMASLKALNLFEEPAIACADNMETRHFERTMIG